MTLGTWDKTTVYPGETDQTGNLVSPPITPDQLPQPKGGGLIDNAISNVKQTFAQNQQNSQESFNRALAKDPTGKNVLNAVAPAVDILGNTAGDINSVVLETLNVLTGGLLKTGLTGIQKGVNTALDEAGDAGEAAGQAAGSSALATEAAKNISPESKKKIIDFFSKDNPNAMDDLNAIINVGMLVMQAKGASEGAGAFADLITRPTTTSTITPEGVGSNVVDATATEAPQGAQPSGAPDTGNGATGTQTPPPGSWQSMLKSAQEALQPVADKVTQLTKKSPKLNFVTDSINKAVGKQIDATTLAERNVKQLTTIEENNTTLSDVQNNALRRGFDPKQAVAATDLLAGSVNKEGTILTEGPGRALDKLDQATKWTNSVVRDAAEREKAAAVNPGDGTVSLKQVQSILTQEADSLTGAEKISTLNAIRREMAGYQLDANPDGTIDVAKLQDAKIAKQNAISNTQWADPNAKAGAKAIAKGLQRLVENNVKSLDVKTINQELSRIEMIREYLQALDHKKVIGGRLGKMVGSITGSLPGVALGGSLGMIVAVLGDLGMTKLTEELFKGKLQGAGGNIPISDALRSAVSNNKQPIPAKPAPLQLPAPDPSKSGPTITPSAPTTYEPRAKIVKTTDTGVPKQKRLVPQRSQVEQIWKNKKR